MVTSSHLPDGSKVPVFSYGLFVAWLLHELLGCKTLFNFLIVTYFIFLVLDMNQIVTNETT